MVELVEVVVLVIGRFRVDIPVAAPGILLLVLDAGPLRRMRVGVGRRVGAILCRFGRHCGSVAGGGIG